MSSSNSAATFNALVEMGFPIPDAERAAAAHPSDPSVAVAMLSGEFNVMVQPAPESLEGTGRHHRSPAVVGFAPDPPGGPSMACHGLALNTSLGATGWDGVSNVNAGMGESRFGVDISANERDEIEEEALEAELIEAVKACVPMDRLEHIRRAFFEHGDVGLALAQLQEASVLPQSQCNLEALAQRAQIGFVALLREGLPVETEEDVAAAHDAAIPDMSSPLSGLGHPQQLAPQDQAAIADIRKAIGLRNEALVLGVYLQCGRDVHRAIEILSSM